MTVDSPEFTAMLEKIPKYIALTPLVHRWQAGDIYNDRKRWEWTENDLNLGELVPDNDEGQNACREIPLHIRRNAAFWALYEKIADVRPFGGGFGYKIADDFNLDTLEIEFNVEPGLCKFSSEDDCKAGIHILGGEQNIIAHLSSGCLLPKWMAGEI